MDDLKLFHLPKSIASDPRAPQLLKALATPNRRLWSGGALKVPEAHLSDTLQEALLASHRAGRVVRSLEKAEILLAAEAHGQGLADRRSGTPRGIRISRLLVLADDGAERFYRQVESLLELHGPRVVAVCLTTDAEGLGRMLFGPGSAARLLMIEHKEAVGAVLLALAEQWTPSEAGGAA
jgi:hypothetical protein